ncbi:MAG: hypothetical protein A2285_10205 [Elusimicrobia bacterium RIFOXYA12_FULL_57_11]|nr:MAG: hypothetical protein A2285_10205 [Elusimicrobia bacterium RIFOXYA12_FULL_57_11]
MKPSSVLSRVKDLSTALAASRRFTAALPAALIAIFCVLDLWLVWLSFNFGSTETAATYVQLGSYLLAGLPNGDVVRNMPFFGVVSACLLNYGVNSNLIFILLHLGIYTLVFWAGCLLRGYWAGVLALLAAGLFGAQAALNYNGEQAFYSFLLMLVLSLLLLKRRENTIRNSVLCGLAIGMSLLVRTPLLFFPLLVVLIDWFYNGARFKSFLLRSALFLAASYVLLLPWGALNYSVTGKFSISDERRAACNLITSARGSVYIMEGDPLKLASIGAGDSPFSFFIREAAKDPFFYALTVARRLWHIFLFYPLLFGLFIAAMVFGRDKDKLAVFALPAYFILVHSLLSIGERYFYPLVYVLPSLIAGSFLRGNFDVVRERFRWARKAGIAALWLSLCAVLAVEAVIIAYPHKAARNAADETAVARLARRFPGDRVVQELYCRRFWLKGDDSGFYGCLGAYAEKFGDKFIAYFIPVLSSRTPAGVPLPADGGEMKCYTTMNSLITRMLREVELGDLTAALESYKLAYASYEAGINMLHWEPYRKEKERDLALKRDSGGFFDRYLYRASQASGTDFFAISLFNIYYGYKELIGVLRGGPYARDAELAWLIKQDSGYFWERYVYDRLVLWPPAGITKILAGLEKGTSFPGADRLSWRVAGEIRSPGIFRGRRLSGSDFKGTSVYARRMQLLHGETVRRSDSAAGPAAARRPPGTAEAGGGPRALFALCLSLAAENRKEQALQACQGVVYAVDVGTGTHPAWLAIVRNDAAFESYRLLKALGRSEEAQATLIWTVENAPESWPGLAKARESLGATVESGKF